MGDKCKVRREVMHAHRKGGQRSGAGGASCERLWRKNGSHLGNGVSEQGEGSAGVHDVTMD